MKWMIFLLLLSKISAWSGVPVISRNELKIMTSLEHVLHLILTRTCAANNMSIFVSTEFKEELESGSKHLVDSVLDKMLHRLSLDAQVPIVLDKKLQVELNQHVQLMLFFVQDTQQFLRSVIGNAGATATHKHKFLVVLLAKGDDKESREIMSQIFSYMLHERYNIDVLLLLAQLKLGVLRSFTFFPFGNASNPACESFEPMLMPLKQAQLKQLYPNKLQNLQGCPLHVIVWHIPPYILLEPDLPTKPKFQHIPGWDAKLLQLLANRLNFRINLLHNEPPHATGGETHMNGSFTGAYRMLREHRGNLTLGCAACLPARAKYLSNTISYNTVEFVIVLREGISYSNYEIMLFPFDFNLWLLLLFLAVLRLLSSFINYYFSPLQLGWLMLLFVIRASYEGSIFEFVHNAPVRPLPRSLEQAVLEDYSFIMDNATYRFVVELPILKGRAKELPGLAVDMFDKLLSQPPKSRIGLFTSRDFLAYYLEGHREQRHRFVVLENKIVNNILCMHLPLGSYFTHTISQMLFDLRSFGICQQLTKVPNWSNLDAATSNYKHHHKDAFAESMQFLHAACYCLVFAESLILCFFLLEILSQHSRFFWLEWLFRHL